MLKGALKSGNAEAEYLSSTFSMSDEEEREFDDRRLFLIQSSAKKKYPPAIYLGFRKIVLDRIYGLSHKMKNNRFLT